MGIQWWFHGNLMGIVDVISNVFFGFHGDF